MTSCDSVLINDPVCVRDSWDNIETPRRSCSDCSSLLEEDCSTFEKLKSKAKNSKRVYEDNLLSASKLLNTNELTLIERNKSDFLERLPQAPPMSSFVRETKLPKTTSRRYRNLKIRTHDEMLQEQYDQLQHLLRDSENMSKDELSYQHVKQTESMIAGFKEMNNGAPARGIIISRSLPEALRPKSPRSSSSSSTSNSTPREMVEMKHSSSRSPFQNKRSTKRVSFEPPLMANSQDVKPNIAISRKKISAQDITIPSAHVSLANSDLASQENSASQDFDDSQNTLNQLEHSKHTDHQTKPESDNTVNGDSVEILSIRKATEKQECTRIANTELEKTNRHKEFGNGDNGFLPRTEKQKLYGIIEMNNGTKKSDSNLKRTSNPDIRRWLKEKELAVKQMKKKNRQTEEKEKAAAELEEQQKAERKVESDKQLKRWKASKRKQARLLRRQNLAKRKITVQHISGSANNLENPKGAQEEKDKPTCKKVPSASRPKSAPPSRSFKTKQVPLQEVIQNSPGLQDKIQQLEKHKRLKHRQSYDEWLKVKEAEKKETLKLIQEKRQKLEKEISEETAKIISEAARRRLDNLRYKGSDTKQTEKKQAKEDSAPKEGTNQQPHSRRENTQPSTNPTKKSKQAATAATRPTPMSAKQYPRFRSSKQNIEDKLTSNESSNPFSDPFKRAETARPRSRLEENGINGPEFSSFIWNLVNEQEKNEGGSNSQHKTKPKEAPTGTPQDSKRINPEPSQSQTDRDQDVGQPVIEGGKTIFSMTSIE